MKNSYQDILDLGNKTQSQPKWWDSNGVPRFCDFHPKNSPNIYADEVVLLKIACQSCAHQFDVELNTSLYENLTITNFKKFIDRPQDIYYGDPPNIRCCLAGPTMSSISLYVIEFWTQENFKWVRHQELENIPIEKLEDYFGEEQ